MTRSNTGVVSLIGLMTVMFFVFLVSTAFVEDQKKEETKKPSAAASALKAGQDADGAVRRPTHAEENKLNAELQKTLAKYPKHNAKQNANGALSLVVAPHLVNAAVAHKGPDGKLHLNCSDEKTHAVTSVEAPKE